MSGVHLSILVIKSKWQAWFLKAPPDAIRRLTTKGICTFSRGECNNCARRQ